MRAFPKADASPAASLRLLSTDIVEKSARVPQQGVEAVIPSTASRRAPIPYDVAANRDRNRVERMWCRLKDFRRVATRYDKLARNYLAGVIMAATCAYWID